MGLKEKEGLLKRINKIIIKYFVRELSSDSSEHLLYLNMRRFGRVCIN